MTKSDSMHVMRIYSHTTLPAATTTLPFQSISFVLISQGPFANDGTKNDNIESKGRTKHVKHVRIVTSLDLLVGVMCERSFKL